MIRYVLIPVAVLLLAGSALADAATGVFRAGAATSNITPWLGTSINGNFTDRKAEYIHDELHVRCLVLDDGKTRLGFAVVDSCMVPREIVAGAKATLAQEGTLAADHLSISATHTHESGCMTPVFQSDPDPQYQAFVESRIVDGIRCAVKNLAPARIAWGKGALPGEVHNRRWRMKPGTIGADPFGRTGDQVRMNPGTGNPDCVEPAGPVDPEISVLAVQGLDGAPMAVFANYGLHYVGGEGPGHVSADYYGYFASHLAQKLNAAGAESGFVAMMSNGTSGDVNNIDVTKPSEARSAYEQMRHVADAAADEVARVYQGLSWRDAATLDARAAELELGVRMPSPEDVAQAEKTLAEAGKGGLHTAPQVYARETTLLAKYPKTVPVTVQAFRVGDLVIAQIPCEVFAEIGLRLKRESALQSAFTISLANGYNGYLPTPQQHVLGGYETWRARSSYLEFDASEKITAALLGLVNNLALTGK